MNERPLTVLAYEHTGMARVSHEVEVGDQVDWKRQGTRGSYRCYVRNVWRSPSGRTMLLVKPFEHDGHRLGEEQIEVKITGRHILAVYNMQGERKEPVRQ